MEESMLEKTLIEEDGQWCWYIDNFLVAKWNSLSQVDKATSDFLKQINKWLYLDKYHKTYHNEEEAEA